MSDKASYSTFGGKSSIFSITDLFRGVTASYSIR